MGANRSLFPTPDSGAIWRRCMQRSLSLFAAVLAASLFAGLATPGLSVAQAADNPTADSNQPVTDAWITTKVKSELAATGGVKSMDVSVETNNGIVVLTG